MHNAPPVVFPAGRFFWARCVAGLLALLAGGCLALWLWQTNASVAMFAWAVFGWSATTLCCMGLLPHEFLQQGELAWDGEAWHGCFASWQDGPMHLTLIFDGGHFMLVSLRAMAQADRSVWARYACLHRVDMPSCWHGFRCAVYSRPKGVAQLA